MIFFCKQNNSSDDHNSLPISRINIIVMKTSAAIAVICVASTNAAAVKRMRTKIEHKSRVTNKSDETYDPFLGLTNRRNLLGESYCTYSPDKSCYITGWPACCLVEGTCPEEQPPCEIPDMSMSMPSLPLGELGIGLEIPAEEPAAQGGSGSGEATPEDLPTSSIETEDPVSG